MKMLSHSVLALVVFTKRLNAVYYVDPSICCRAKHIDNSMFSEVNMMRTFRKPNVIRYTHNALCFTYSISLITRL